MNEVSTCCGYPVEHNGEPICPKCKEHCDTEIISDDTEIPENS